MPKHNPSIASVIRELGAAAAAVTILAAVQPAAATPITYVERGVMSGTLNGTRFNNASVTIMTLADTANIKSLNYLGYPTYENAGTTTIRIPGFGTATFNGRDSFGAFSQNLFPGGIVVGIEDLSGPQSILYNRAVPSSSLSSPFYDLSTATRLTGFAISNHGVVFSTTLGPLVVFSTSGNATFTATTRGLMRRHPSSLRPDQLVKLRAYLAFPALEVIYRFKHLAPFFGVESDNCVYCWGSGYTEFP